MYKYENVSDREQALINFGLVKAGGTIDTVLPVENPNFKYIGEVQNENPSEPQPVDVQPPATSDEPQQDITTTEGAI